MIKQETWQYQETSVSTWSNNTPSLVSIS